MNKLSIYKIVFIAILFSIILFVVTFFYYMSFSNRFYNFLGEGVEVMAYSFSSMFIRHVFFSFNIGIIPLLSLLLYIFNIVRINSLINISIALIFIEILGGFIRILFIKNYFINTNGLSTISSSSVKLEESMFLSALFGWIFIYIFSKLSKMNAENRNRNKSKSQLRMHMLL